MTTAIDPDIGAREALRLLEPDPDNWHQIRITGDIAPDFEDSLYAAAVWKRPVEAVV